MALRALFLSVVLVALLLVDRSQRDAAAERREVALRVRTLVSAEVRESRPVAVVRVQDGDGRVDIYGRQQGQWRCLSWRGAPALGDRLEQLILDLYEAQGVVLSEQPEQPQDYGLDVSAMRTVSLHGPAMKPQDPSSDLVVALEVGAPVVGADGCYARIRGERAIWTIDTDPGDIVGREPSGGRPALLDQALVPATWPGEGPRLKTLSIAHAGQDEFELEMRQRETTPEEAMQGMPGFEWILEYGGREQPASTLLATSYANHVVTAPWVDVVDPALAPALGFDTPRAQLTLYGGGPDPCRLVLGGRTPSGRSAVLNTFSRLVFEIDPASEPLLFPQAAALLPEATGNPWAREQPPAAPPPLVLPQR